MTGTSSKSRQLMAMISLLAVFTQAGLVDAYPVGGEFQINSNVDDPNTTADNDQQLPDVAMDAAGNAVVVFQNDVPGAGITVAARLYNAAGAPKGAQFRVNTSGPNDSTFPSVGMGAGGNFVVVWADNFADGSSDGIMVRRYNAAGAALGAQFAINTSTAGRQYLPDIAVSANGKFVVVWQDNQSGNLKRRVRGRYFNADGSPHSGELEISTDTAIDHTQPRVAIDADGDFVVCWQSGIVGSNQDLAVRRFDANGNPKGPPTLINGSTRVDNASQIHSQASVAMDAQGNYIVVWRADNHTGPGIAGAAIGILGRPFKADGSSAGLFVVDTAHAPQLNMPEIAMNPHGDFVVAYERQDASLVGIWIQRYYADAVAKGAPFQANTFTTLGQTRPSIAVDTELNALVSWESSQQDGAGDGVFAQLLSGQGLQAKMDFNNDFRADIPWRHNASGANALWQMHGAVVQAAQFLPGVADPNWRVVGVADFDGDGNADLLWRHQVNGSNGIWFMNGFTVLRTGPIVRVADSDWRIAGTGDFNRDSRADLLWRHQVTGNIVIFLLDGSQLKGLASVAVPGPGWQVAAVDDFNADGKSDIVLRHSSGLNALWLMEGMAISSGQFLLTVADLNWRIDGSGDVDRDGKADLFWRHGVTGSNAVWLMDGFTLKAAQQIQGVSDLDWQVEALSDFNRDAKADILWRHGASGNNTIWMMDGFNILSDQATDAIVDTRWMVVP